MNSPLLRILQLLALGAFALPTHSQEKPPPAGFEAAMAIAREGRRRINDTLGEFDVLVVPSSQGEAPKGNATGLPYFNRNWSLLHTPAVHVPYGHGPNHLPIGFQVVGRIGDDARTLSAAHWLQVNVARK